MNQSLQYTLDYNDLMDSNPLQIYYDFATGEVIGGVGLIYNQLPAANTGLYSGYVLNATTEAQLFNNFLNPIGSGNMAESNIQISGGFNFNFNNMSVLMQYEQYGTDSCILLGSLDRFVINSIPAASGFNFGINSFGRPFFQHIDKGQDYICSTDINLAENNILSFAVSNGRVEISRYDYNRNSIETNSFNVNTNALINGSDIYIGGANNFYRSTDNQQPTVSGYLGSLLIFSKYLQPSTLYTIGSGLISSYNETPESSVVVGSRVTGYIKSPIYPTGITGYSVSYSSQNIDASGKHKIYSGSFSTSTIYEGQSYLTGELFGLDFAADYEGLLINPVTFDYNPTGTEPRDTLGLRDVSTDASVFTSSIIYSSPDISGLLTYQADEVTGFLDEATGYSNEPLYESVSGIIQGSSGISLNLAAIENHNYNYIYYFGDRI